MRLLIDGALVEAADGQRRDISNPATEAVITSVPEAGLPDMARAIAAARQAFDAGPWRAFHVAQRADLLERISDLILAHEAELVALECQNVGRPLSEIEGDIRGAAQVFKYFSRAVVALMGQTAEVPDRAVAMTVREPRGVVGLIVPWNYPLPEAAIKLAPALAAGNTCVIKPSELTPLSLLRLGHLIQAELDLPPGVINIVSGDGPTVGAALVGSPQVDFVSFTGGTETGKAIMRLAAETLKPLTLELGGKSANIILEDADFDAAVAGAIMGIFQGHGQNCVAGSRLFVQRSLYPRLVEAVAEAARQIRIGDPLSRETEMGPLISRVQWEQVSRYVALGQREGARLVTGGRRPPGSQFERGHYFQPTVFDEVEPQMTIAQEEIFGPVLSVIPFTDVAEGIALANATCYGLAGAVWTRDIFKANEVARALRAGTVWINNYNAVYNELPYGGYKQSGFGRAMGLAGLEEYSILKQIAIKLAPEAMPAYGRHARS